MSSNDTNQGPGIKYDENGEQSFDLIMLANFVHQIVNPLNGIAGTLDNLVRGTFDERRRDQRLNAARAQVEQCIALLRNLAFLTKGTGAIENQDRKLVVLPQVIIEAAMFYQEEGNSKNIRITLVDRATQNRVSGHPELIRQVLMNIFDNCIKYGKFGSPIEVRQWIQSNTNMAMITIKGESSESLASGDKEHIFDLGFRGSNAKRMIASGTGLGLYICKQIIERHGGEIYAQTVGVSGILFTIKIPDGRADTRRG